MLVASCGTLEMLLPYVLTKVVIMFCWSYWHTPHQQMSSHSRRAVNIQALLVPTSSVLTAGGQAQSWGWLHCLLRFVSGFSSDCTNFRTASPNRDKAHSGQEQIADTVKTSCALQLLLSRTKYTAYQVTCWGSCLCPEAAPSLAAVPPLQEKQRLGCWQKPGGVPVFKEAGKDGEGE